MSGDDAFDGLELRAIRCAAGYRSLFDAIDLRLSSGQWLMLSGPNGTGKTTLLRAIAGLARPLSGEIRWRGRTRRASDAEWHADCLYQGHTAGWKDSFSTFENLRWQAELDGAPTLRRVLSDALARVGLEKQTRLPFVRLSAGQRRRLSLARLSLSGRPLWLLDEPATALDVEGQQRLAELLDEHLSRAGSAVVASHQPLPCRTGGATLDVSAARPPQ